MIMFIYETIIRYVIDKSVFVPYIMSCGNPLENMKKYAVLLETVEDVDKG